MTKQLEISLEDLNNDNGSGGLEIIIPGVIGNPQDANNSPIFIEYYKGELRIAIWDNTQDPQIIPIKHLKKGASHE